MDATLSETQRLLRDSLRDYLSNEVPFDRIRTRGRRRPGPLGLPPARATSPCPSPSATGEGRRTPDAAILLEELTRRACIIPFMETTAAALAIERHGDAALADGSRASSPALDRLQPSTPGNGASPRVVESHYAADGRNTSSRLPRTANDSSMPATTRSRPLSTIARTPLPTAPTMARRAGGAEALQFPRRAGRALCAVQCRIIDMTVFGMRDQFGRRRPSSPLRPLGARFLTYRSVWSLDQGVASGQIATKALAPRRHRGHHARPTSSTAAATRDHAGQGARPRLGQPR